MEGNCSGLREMEERGDGGKYSDRVMKASKEKKKKKICIF